MSVTIGKPKEQKQVIEPETTEAPTEEKVEVKELTVVEKLKVVKKQLEDKYGSVAIFKLPNEKRIFIRVPSYEEYSLYEEKVEKSAYSHQLLMQGKQAITADSISDCKKHMVKTCIIDLGENPIVGNFSDVMKYPACIDILLVKIEKLAGAGVEEDFLD